MIITILAIIGGGAVLFFVIGAIAVYLTNREWAIHGGPK